MFEYLITAMHCSIWIWYLMETSDADMLQDILIDTVIADAHAAAIEN